MKIFAIGLNYAEHIKELNSSIPSEPVVFMKPDSAILRSNKPFFFPNFSKEIHYETEILIKINRIGKNITPKFANRYYEEIGLGIDFTARDLQRKLKDTGNPWEICKGFDQSALIGDFVHKDKIADIQQVDFHLDINGTTVQQGNSKDMIFNIDEIISYISQFFTLKIGDIIYTGTPAGVGPIQINDRLQGYLSDKLMFDFQIK